MDVETTKDTKAFQKLRLGRCRLLEARTGGEHVVLEGWTETQAKMIVGDSAPYIDSTRPSLGCPNDQGYEIVSKATAW